MTDSDICHWKGDRNHVKETNYEAITVDIQDSRREDRVELLRAIVVNVCDSESDTKNISKGPIVMGWDRRYMLRKLWSGRWLPL
jgi:hypothetical protein